jgi:signal transduction histidine kinase
VKNRRADLAKSDDASPHQLRRRKRHEDARDQGKAHNCALETEAEVIGLEQTESTPRAEQAKQMAIAQQQEQIAKQRAAKLDKANEVLKRSLHALALDPQLSTFLGHVLAVLTEQLGGLSSTLWLLDDDKRHFCLHSVCEDGRVLSAEESGHPLADSPQRIPTADPTWIAIQAKRPFVQDDPASNASYFPPVQRALFAKLGVRALVWLPLVFGEDLIGTLAVRMSEKCAVDEEELELAHALAQQATLALELTRLAEQAKQAAIAREQEKLAKEQASKLSKTNAALKQSLQALAQDPDLNSFLGHLLVEMAGQFGTTSSAVFLIERPARRLIPHLIYENGRLIPGKDSDHPIVKNPRVFAADDPVWLAFCRNEPIIRRNPQSDTTLGWTEAHRAYYTKKRITGILNVPLIFGGEVVGTLAIQFRDQRDIGQEAIELTQTFGLQATLAFQLTKMAEQSKQIAIAKEQELFARQRAAELGRANDALRGCLDALASVPELDEFLEQVMAAIARQLGANGGTVWLYDFEQNTARLELSFQNDGLIAGVEAGYAEAARSVPLDQVLASDRQFSDEDRPVFVWRLDRPYPPWDEFHRRYLIEFGTKTVLVIALTSKKQAIGRLTFHFQENREFSPEELEISRALAHQAGLAIKLTRLARGAKQAAILGERNRMAGEIHDSLAQSFVGISMQLDAAEAATSKAKGLRHIQRANELAQFGLAEARRSVLSLRSGVQAGGLVKAVQQLVERSSVAGILRCELRSEDVPDESIPPEVEHELVRICQEAISNAVRHAKPTVITITLRWNTSNLILQVTDNGSGITGNRLEQSEGFGMANMRARVAKLGGKLQIETGAGRGTSIIVTLQIGS